GSWPRGTRRPGLDPWRSAAPGAAAIWREVHPQPGPCFVDTMRSDSGHSDSGVMPHLRLLDASAAIAQCGMPSWKNQRSEGYQDRRAALLARRSHFQGAQLEGWGEEWKDRSRATSR